MARTTDGGLPWMISNKLRRSVLDAVLADAKRLQIDRGCGGLEAHRRSHGSVRSLEMRIPMTAAWRTPPTADVPGSDDSDGEGREPGPVEGHRHEHRR